MENYKIVSIIFVLFFIYCSSIDIPSTGWDYIADNNIELAHREFLRDFVYDSLVEDAAGLGYTFYLLNVYDSSKYYINIAENMDIHSDYTLFVSLYYNTFNNIAKGDTIYKLFIEKHGISLDDYIIENVFDFAIMHKMGLMCEYELGNFQYTYDILKSISNIPTNLDMTDSDDIKILLDYINNLENHKI